MPCDRYRKKWHIKSNEASLAQINNPGAQLLQPIHIHLMKMKAIADSISNNTFMKFHEIDTKNISCNYKTILFLQPNINISYALSINTKYHILKWLKNEMLILISSSNTIKQLHCFTTAYVHKELSNKNSRWFATGLATLRTRHFHHGFPRLDQRFWLIESQPQFFVENANQCQAIP